jgi:hypothetical protein
MPRLQRPNVEEPIDRVVGRRVLAPDPLNLASDRRADAKAWQQALGGIPLARGVYRFRTHEEADEWLWRTITRPRTR